MKVTGERDNFAIHGLNYYQTAFELFREGPRAIAGGGV